MQKQRLTLRQLERLRAWDTEMIQFARNFGNARQPLPSDLAALEFEAHEDVYYCKDRNLVFAKELLDKDGEDGLMPPRPL